MSLVKASLNKNTFFLLQQQLNQIKAWREQVSIITKSFCTTNGIFFVECRELQLWILPKLNNIFKQLVQMVVLDVIRLSDEEVKDVEKLSEVQMYNVICIGNHMIQVLYGKIHVSMLSKFFKG